MSAPPLPIAARVRRWHAPHGLAGAPLGVSAIAPAGAPIEAGDAVWIAPPALAEPDSPDALLPLLPELAAVRGALVVVAPGAALGLFARMFRPRAPLARAVRGSALLLRGYQAIGGGVDPVSGLDLAWGEAP